MPFSPQDLLEEEYREDYLAWKKDPSPQNNAKLLKKLHPIIEGAVKTHVGQVDPLVMSRARLLALEALNRYDPTRARLNTHIYNHLLGIKRIHRKQNQILHVPERIQIAHSQMQQAEKELEHQLGRLPNDDELANYTGFSRKQLAKLRKYRPAVAEGTISQATENMGPKGGVYSMWNKERPAYIDAVYDELDDYHRTIMEYTFGMNGKPQLANKDIAGMLKRSPGAISQAKARIQQKLDEAEELMSTEL